jgi:hypothetical protein
MHGALQIYDDRNPPVIIIWAARCCFRCLYFTVVKTRVQLVFLVGSVNA